MAKQVVINGIAYPGEGVMAISQMIQINDYGPEQKESIVRPKVTPSDDGTLKVNYIDEGQDVRLRVLLRWEKSDIPPHNAFIASAGVVGEEEIAFVRPLRFAPISEIIGSPIICHARFQSR
jgi:hypothetical protein